MEREWQQRSVLNMLFFMIAAFIFWLEYFIKRHMDKVRTLREERPLAGGRIILKKYYNTGAAGNMLSRYPKAVRFIHKAVLGIVFSAFLFVPKKDALTVKTGLSFMLGGGCSNLYDRITKGHVVDYISFGFGPKRFQKLVFNAADFFVFLGVILCMIHLIKKEGEL